MSYITLNSYAEETLSAAKAINQVCKYSPIWELSSDGKTISKIRGEISSETITIPTSFQISELLPKLVTRVKPYYTTAFLTFANYASMWYPDAPLYQLELIALALLIEDEEKKNIYNEEEEDPF